MGRGQTSSHLFFKRKVREKNETKYSRLLWGKGKKGLEKK